MGTLLIRNARVLVTMDNGLELEHGFLFARDGLIEAVGHDDDVPETADEVVDLTGHVVLPGLVNTHHHLYQTLTRAVPGAQDVGLFPWLRALYPIWARMTPDHVRVSTRLGLTEMALTGATTVFDHQYLWPNGSRIDDQFEGADGLNIRFAASRGSMSLGESEGGLPPDSVVEDEQDIFDDTARAVDQFHDSERGAMRSVVIAPCSPFSVTPDLMRASAAQARELGVLMHTHVAETRDEEEFCLQTFGMRPVEYMEDLGWTGPDVWFAHAVHVADEEVDRLSESATGVAHCPTSNMRLASGMAPVGRFMESGARVGLGVDGSASNDSADMIGEVRQTMLLNRLIQPLGGQEEGLISARDALELATIGGTSLLGRDDLGRLAPGYAADLVAVDLDRVELAGALHDPVAAMVFCAPGRIDHSWVAGRRLVDNGQVVGVDQARLIEEHNRLSLALTD